METNFKSLVRLYYTALMTFLVFTFADSLLQGIVNSYCVDILLYIFMWFFLVVQTTYAYVHIESVKPEDYTVMAFLSDSIDIGIAIYVCAAIGSTYNGETFSELKNYQHLSIPFLILAINQFTWYVIVKEFNILAIFRICILFVGMLAITISEGICHSFWNLIAVVLLVVVLGILRAINKSPLFFNKIVTKLWIYIKTRHPPVGGHDDDELKLFTDANKVIIDAAKGN